MLWAHFTPHFNYFAFINTGTKDILRYPQSPQLPWMIFEIPGVQRIKWHLQSLKIKFCSYSMISSSLQKDINAKLALLVLGQGQAGCTKYFLSDIFVLHASTQCEESIMTTDNFYQGKCKHLGQNIFKWLKLNVNFMFFLTTPMQ